MAEQPTEVPPAGRPVSERLREAREELEAKLLRLEEDERDQPLSSGGTQRLLIAYSGITNRGRAYPRSSCFWTPRPRAPSDRPVSTPGRVASSTSEDAVSAAAARGNQDSHAEVMCWGRRLC